MPCLGMPRLYCTVGPVLLRFIALFPGHSLLKLGRPDDSVQRASCAMKLPLQALEEPGEEASWCSFSMLCAMQYAP